MKLLFLLGWLRECGWSPGELLLVFLSIQQIKEPELEGDSPGIMDKPSL